VSGLVVADLLAHLEAELPAHWAEPWDRVGLLVGDRDAGLERVFVSLDPTPAALARAVSAGASVLLTHHPVFLASPETFVPAAGMAGVPFAAAVAGVALVSQHTNLDRSPPGADALPHKLGLAMVGPLERSSETVSVIVTYAPVQVAERVREALASAGAGRIGMYGGCSFSSAGTGRFTALPGSGPDLGKVGESTTTAEERIEVVCAPGLVDAAVAALRASHPYEEPVITVGAVDVSRGSARMGRVCEATAGCTVGSLARDVASRLGIRPTVWGDPDARVLRIAIAPGSGRSLVAAAIQAGCDAVVTGELRYHEALDAAASGIAVIEAGHDATEWPLTAALAEIAARTPGLSAAQVRLDEPETNWWTAEGA
jgi:dinuclear metal center YbgI/SA1388 family protein